LKLPRRTPSIHEDEGEPLVQTIRIRVSGRVQGVGYRAAMRREAQRLGLSGWVRNRVDGTVEAMAAGPDAAVTALADWARLGPPLAQVASVVVEPVEPAGAAEAPAGEWPAGFRQRPTA
jgi:acylphosphatase